MAIYVRNQDGEMEPYKIVGLKGEDGITPNITIGTVTTLEAGEQATVVNSGTKENPIFNFGIPKGESGVNSSSNNVSIDDNTIATDKTWSSSRIEDFVLNNDDVIWSTVQGENLSVDYTKEGYLREVEIWGNTIQNEADLSDIQHLGELYVDSEGRKQYKIEVVSVDGFNIYKEGLIKVDKNKTYHFGSYYNNNQNTNWYVYTINAYDKNRTFLRQIYRKNIGEDDIQVPDDCSFIEITANHNIKTFLIEKNFWDKKSSIKNIFAKQTKSHKTTLLLPCQLMKVGDISDRLQWDSSKGRYVVEKNVDKTQLVSDKNFDNASEYQKHYICYYNRHKIPNLSKNGFLVGLQMISTIPSGNGTSTVTDTVGVAWGNNDYRLLVNRSAVNAMSDAREYFNNFNSYVYYPLQTPELIETNITEQILLPSYKDKTHLFVTGGIDGTIKAKAPIDGGKAIQSLSAKNTALTLENEEIKETNILQDELINTTMLATDEIYNLLEPLFVDMLIDKDVSPLLNMYVAMVKRDLKTIEQVPEKYREQVDNIINNKQ